MRAMFTSRNEDYPETPATRARQRDLRVAHASAAVAPVMRMPGTDLTLPREVSAIMDMGKEACLLPFQG